MGRATGPASAAHGRDDGAHDRPPAVPLRPAARRAAASSWSAAGTSPSDGSRGCSRPAPTSSSCRPVTRRPSRGWPARARSPGTSAASRPGPRRALVRHRRHRRPRVNEAVSAAAEERRIFCVRADDATAATRLDPGGRAARRRDGRGARQPRAAHSPPRCATRSSTALRDGEIAAPHERRPHARRGAGRRWARRPRAGHGRRAPRARRGRRRGRRPARAAGAARRAVAGRRAVDVAKLPRGRAAAQEEINRVIVDRALAGKRVVRFKGGDPFVFGRGYEEALACAEAGVPCTVIPGLTSAIAVPAVAGIPVTHRGVAHEFTVISGHLPPGPPRLAGRLGRGRRLRGTLVLLMAVQNLPRDRRPARRRRPARDDAGRGRLRRHHARRADPARPRSARSRRTWHATGVRPPAIVVVGDVVAVAQPRALRRG